MARSAHLKWFGNKLRRRSRQMLCRRFYRERDHDIANAALLAGTARCGSTWVADLVRSQTRCRIMFEPFDNRQIADIRQYHYIPYLRPENEYPEMYDYCRKIFSGEIRHPWIDREVAHFRPRGRLVKAVRANLMFGWIAAHFPEIPRVLIIRHPCAVVLSRMRAGWEAQFDLQSLLAQKELRRDFLDTRLGDLSRWSSIEAQHALVWCISYLVPLKQLAAEDLNLIFYEDLVTRPEEALPRLFRLLGREYRPEVLRVLHRPSTTAAPESAVLTGESMIDSWRHRLSLTQIHNVLEVVAKFGLDGLYGEDGMPVKELVNG